MIIMPNKIKLKKPHWAAGAILTRHSGKAYSVEIFPGCIDVINDGDYIGWYNCHLTPDFLEENPELWEEDV